MKRAGWFDSGIPDTASEERCPVCTRPILVLENGPSRDILYGEYIDTGHEPPDHYALRLPYHICPSYMDTLFENGRLNEKEAERLARIELSLDRICPTCNQPAGSMCVDRFIDHKSPISDPHARRTEGLGSRIAFAARDMTAQKPEDHWITREYRFASVRECEKCHALPGETCFSLVGLKGNPPSRDPIKTPHLPRFSDQDLITMHRQRKMSPGLVKEAVDRGLARYNGTKSGLGRFSRGILNSSSISLLSPGEVITPYVKRNPVPYNVYCPKCKAKIGKKCLNMVDVRNRKKNPRKLIQPHGERYPKPEADDKQDQPREQEV